MRIRVGSSREGLGSRQGSLVAPRRVFAAMTWAAGLCLVVSMGSTVARAQEPEDIDLSAKQRILPGIGPGLRAVRQGADGGLYVLASPSPGLVVVDTKGKPLLSINETPTAADSAAASHSLIAFGDDCDVDAEGKIYVAD